MVETAGVEQHKTTTQNELSQEQQASKKGFLGRLRDRLTQALLFLDRNKDAPEEVSNDTQRIRRRDFARTLLQEVASGASTGVSEGLRQEGELQVGRMIENAQKPFGEAELKDKMAHEQKGIDRRSFIRGSVLLAATLGLPPMVVGGAYAGDKIQKYEDKSDSLFPNGEFVRLVQNATTVIPRADSEWVVVPSLAMIAINTELNQPMLPDGSGNISPGIGYEKILVTTNIQDVVVTAAQEGIAAGAKEARDLAIMGELTADQFDIVYIDTVRLKQTVQESQPDFPVEASNLANRNTLVGYLMDEQAKITGDYQKKPTAYHFGMLLEQAATQGITLERTQESVEAFISSVPPFKGNPDVMQRFSSFILASDENVVCITNIGSKTRHAFLNNLSSAPLPGIPIVLTADIESAQLYSDYLANATAS